MSRKLRLCLAASLFDHAFKGGAERQMMLQAAGFVAAGHDVHVITLADPDQGETDYRSACGAIVHRIALRNLYFPFDARRRPSLLRKAWHAIDVCNPAMGAVL